MKRFVLGLGIDQAVLITLLRWGWNVGAGFVTIVVIANFLTPELQGYYYTFNSLIALQIFTELGLNFAIIQFASHEMVHLSWCDDGTVAGSLTAKRRLQSLVHFAFSWFSVAAVLMIVILLPVGLYFFDVVSLHKTSLTSVTVAWVILVVFTAANLFVSAAIAILEGCGKVANVAMVRLLQAVCAMTLAWCILSLGGGLYALAASSVVMAGVGLIWLWTNYRTFFVDIVWQQTQLPGFAWRTEIWPFQWRIAISFMSGYFFVQLFTPLVFKYHGAIAAGQMGMSLQIIGALNGAAMSWIVTKAPVYGRLIAVNQREQLDSLFFRGLLQSTLFLLFAITTVLLVLLMLTQVAPAYAARVIPLSLFVWLGLVCLANHILYAEAAYLRAHKEEPFMAVSVMIGLATAALAITLIPSMGLAGAVYAYAATTLSIGLVGGTALFASKRKQWMLNRAALDI